MYKILLLACCVLLSVPSSAQQKPSTAVQEAIATAKKHTKDSSYYSYLQAALTIADNEHDNYGKATVMQLMGNFYYNRNADSSITYNNAAMSLLNNVGDRRRAAICLHSIAFVYDEIKHDNTRALQYAEQSIEQHRQLSDTLEMANMYKYTGMLKGRLKRFAEAKEDINIAIQYYAARAYEPGIAVSHFDLAQVYATEGKTDSTLLYLNLAKRYWLMANNQGRIFLLNNYFFDTYFKAGMVTDAGRVLQENEQITGSEELYYTDRLKYYNNAALLYGKINNTAKMQQYRKEYSTLKDSLVQKGVNLE